MVGPKRFIKYIACARERLVLQANLLQRGVKNGRHDQNNKCLVLKGNFETTIYMWSALLGFCCFFDVW